MTIVPPIVRLVHPGPAAAVIALSAVLASVLSAQAGHGPLTSAWLLTVLGVAGSQILTGALNDWADRTRDAVAQPDKPIPSGRVTPRAALLLAGGGAALQLAATIPLGAGPVALGVVASGSAIAYNLWLSRTPMSVVPYLVSFGTLPLWIAAGVGAPFERVALAPVIVGPFAAAAHLANALRDFDVDRRLASRNLAQVLGRMAAFRVAGGMALGVAAVVGVAFAFGGRVTPLPLALGAIGVGAVALGIRAPDRLWPGMLVAAVAWTAAWALGSG